MVQVMRCGARRGISARVLLGISLIGLGSACGGGGGAVGEDSDGSGGTAPSGPSTILPLVADARVDLPGKVSIFVQVLNANGSPAADLAPEAFRIYENDQSVSLSESQQQLRPRPQVFRSYTHLIVDRSNSVQQNQAAIDAQKEGAGRYVDVVTAQSPESFIKLSWFDGQDHLHAIAGHDIGFTNDAIALHAAIDALDAEPPFSPSTNLYGAVIDALDDLDQVDAQAAAEGIENRSLALVTFTDGTHQAGPIATLDEAVARINQEDSDGQARYSAFTIGLGSEIDTGVLQAIGPDGAEFASEIEDLVPLFEAVGAGVRALANSFYFLSYCSPKTIGSHQLRVSVRPSPAAGDVTFPFDATFFGAGCGFLDVYTRPELAVGAQRAVLADSMEDDLGRVLVCGWRSNGCAEPGCGEVATAFVARFLADPEQPDDEDRLDGRLDPSFGNGGILLLTHAGLAVTGASSIARDPSDGAWLVGGWSRANPLAGVGQASVWRVAADGSTAVQIDMVNPLGVDQVVHDVLIHGQGRLVAVGSRGGATRSSTVWSLDAASLAIDGSFGSGGVFVHPASPTQPFDVATEVALDGLGRIVVLGEGFSVDAPSWNQNRDAKVFVLDALTGELDASFATGGVAFGLDLFSSVPLPVRPSAVTVDALGRIVFAGTQVESLGAGDIRQQPVICRLLENGTPDTSFAGSVGSRFPATGLVTLRLGSTSQPDIDFGRDAAISDVHVDPDGNMLAAGWRTNAEGHTDVAMFAFDANGVPSSSYNVVGFLIEDGSTADGSFETASSLLVHSTGAIWTLGVSRPAPAGTAEIPTVWIDRD